MSFTKSDLQIFIWNHPLSQSTEERDIGVTITNDLKWNTNIFSRCKKVHCVLHAFLRTVSPLATWRTKSDLYKLMVLSIINYCSPVWSPSKAALTKLEQVQNRATAWILRYDCAYTDSLIFLKSIATDIELLDLRYFNLLEGS